MNQPGGAPAVLLTEKRAFSLASYITAGGRTIENVRVGYETYGRLNAAGDNAVFIAHHFTGSSHAAGRYRPGDPLAGYWDAIIGPGKAIDTNRYFVVAADTLANLNREPVAITTGPGSINPATGKPYGSTFPLVTPRDFVQVHKALVDTLGIRKLAAVAGPSGGAIQALEWAAAYPQFVERVIHVIGPGLAMTPYVLAVLGAWTAPIELDPRWKHGDYFGAEAPVDGLARTMKIVTLDCLCDQWAEATFGWKWADAGRNPHDALANRFAIEDNLNQTAAVLAGLYDAAAFVWSSRAYQLFNLEKDLARIKAKVLFVPSKSDRLYPPALNRKWSERLRAQGNHAEVFEIDGISGHLDGLLSIGQAGETIRAFLEK